MEGAQPHTCYTFSEISFIVKRDIDILKRVVRKGHRPVCRVHSPSTVAVPVDIPKY